MHFMRLYHYLQLCTYCRVLRLPSHCAGSYPNIGQKNLQIRQVKTAGEEDQEPGELSPCCKIVKLL
jgi:hypothetical protein